MSEQDQQNNPMHDTYIETTTYPIGQADEKLTKWQETTDDIAEYLEHDLRGDSWKLDQNSQTGRWVHDERDRLMNDEGIRAVTSLVKMSVNKIITLSDVNDDDIARICKRLHLALAKHFFHNQQKYAIKISYLELITTKIMNFVYVGLKKARGGGERQFLSKTERRAERHTMPAQQQSWRPFK